MVKNMKLLVLALLPALLLASQSAIKIAINETSVQEILQIAEGLGGKKLSLIPLGNQTYEVTSSVKVEIENILAKNSISFKYPNIFFIEPNLVSINLTNLSSFVSFNYTEIIVFEKINGFGNLTVPSINITILTAFVRSGVSLQMEIQSVDVQIANVTLNTELKSKEDLALQNAINSNLKAVSLEIEGLIYAEGPKIDMILAGLPKYLPIPPLQMMLDLGLANDTLVESTYMTLAFSGEILTYPYRTSIAPFNPRPLPLLEPGYPLQAQISDYVFQILGNGFWAGVKHNITALPAALPIKLTTDGLGFVIPNLKKTYGSGKNVTIEISPSPYMPYVLLNTSNGLVNLELGMQVRFFVVVSPTNTTHALDLQLIFAAFIDFNIEDFVLDLDIKYMNLLQVQVENSSVGVVNVVLLKKLLVALFKTILPIINALTGNIQIPQPNIPLIFYEMSVTISDGCLLLGAGIV